MIINKCRSIKTDIRIIAQGQTNWFISNSKERKSTRKTYKNNNWWFVVVHDWSEMFARNPPIEQDSSKKRERMKCLDLIILTNYSRRRERECLFLFIFDFSLSFALSLFLSHFRSCSLVVGRKKEKDKGSWCCSSTEQDCFSIDEERRRSNVLHCLSVSLSLLFVLYNASLRSVMITLLSPLFLSLFVSSDFSMYC